MNAILKTILNISVLTSLLMAASSQCFAEVIIQDVSKERAKELGFQSDGSASAFMVFPLGFVA